MFEPLSSHFLDPSDALNQADLSKSIDDLSELALRPIETDEDLLAVIQFIKMVDPELFGTMFALLEEKRVPISIHVTANSKARKSLYAVLNRESAYASAVEIRSGASIFEVIHEVTHAIPLRKLPQPLATIPQIRIDTSLSVSEIKEALIQIAC